MTWLVQSRCYQVQARRSAFLCHSNSWCGWWRALPCPSASPRIIAPADPGIGGAVRCGTSWETYSVCHTYVAHINESCHKYEWVISHVWVRHVVHMDGSYHTYEIGRAAHHGMSSDTCWICHTYVTHMNESCYPCTWVALHVYMRHVVHMHELCCTYELDEQRLCYCVAHVKHLKDLCPIHECVLSHICMGRVARYRHTWHHTHREPRIWTGHGTQMSESRHEFEWIMSHMNELYPHMNES